MSKKEQARDWLRTVAGKHLASNARNYKFTTIANEAAIQSTLGFQMDINPVEGKIVDENNDWLLVKTARTEFAVIEKTLLLHGDTKVIPAAGSTVRVTPYHRRRFDGKLVGAPEESISESGFRCRSFMLGDSDSRLPIDKNTIKSSYLKDMIEQIRKLPVGDGIRNIGNALVDAGGSNPALLGWNDPDDEDAATSPPSLTFAIDTLVFNGSLSVEYNRAMDYYNLVLVKGGAEFQRVENVDFESLGGQIVGLVDDGEWRFAKLEVLKAAIKKAA